MDNQNQSKVGLFWGLLLLSAVVLGLRLNEGVLLEDPARYACVAKSIVSTGDWITMHEGPSRLYFNKPPLHFWGTALLFKLFGEGPVPARLLSVLSGIGAVLLVAGIARRFWDGRAALWAGCSLLLCGGFIRYVSPGRLDAPQLFWMCLSLWGVVVGLTSGRWSIALLPGLALGLGILTKGPLILAMFPVWGGCIYGWTRMQKPLPPHFGLGLLLGCGLGALLALPWHWAVASANPGFMDHYFGHEMVDRAAGSWQDAKSRWHFLYVLMVQNMPWAAMALLGLGGLLHSVVARKPGSKPEAWPLWTVMAWTVVMAVCAFLPPRMYGRYLMILLPPMALLNGYGVYLWAQSERGFGRMVARVSDGFSARLVVMAICIGVLIQFLPFRRHQGSDKLAIRQAVPLIQKHYSPKQKVPLYLTEFHAPEAVTYFYSGREGVVVTSEDALKGAPLVLTSKGGMNRLKAWGYREALRSKKLVVAEKVD